MNRTTSWVVGVLVFSALYALFFSVAALPELRRVGPLAHAGVQVVGAVVAKEPQNHQRIRYQYRTGSAVYSGIGGTSSRGIPRFEQIRIGDSVPVTYWTEHPEVSVAGSGEEAYMDGLMFAFGLTPFFCILATMLATVGMRVYFSRP